MQLQLTKDLSSHYRKALIHCYIIYCWVCFVCAWWCCSLFVKWIMPCLSLVPICKVMILLWVILRILSYLLIPRNCVTFFYFLAVCISLPFALEIRYHMLKKTHNPAPQKNQSKKGTDNAKTPNPTKPRIK